MKTILVTGASTGFGYQISKTLAENGHKVYAGARKDDDLTNLGKIQNVIPLKLDVTDLDQISTAIDVISKNGSLDVLINNAGIGSPGGVIEMPIENIFDTINVNLYGAIRLVRATIELLIASKGLIINMSSINAYVPATLGGPYNMSKYALEAFSETLRKETRKFGIKVCTVNPGQFQTQIFYKLKNNLSTLINESKYYSNEFQQIYDDLNPDELGLDPKILAETVQQIITIDNPPRSILSAKTAEKNYAYKLIITRLVNLMKASDPDKPVKELIDEILDKVLKK